MWNRGDVSFSVGMVVAAIIYYVCSSDFANQGTPNVVAKEAVEECERSLPRDQTCKWVIAATPFKEDK